MVGFMSDQIPDGLSPGNPPDQDKPAADSGPSATGERVFVNGSSVVVQPGDTLMWITPDPHAGDDVEHWRTLAELLPGVTVACLPSPDRMQTMIVYRPGVGVCTESRAPLVPDGHVGCTVFPSKIHHCDNPHAHHVDDHHCVCGLFWSTSPEQRAARAMSPGVAESFLHAWNQQRTAAGERYRSQFHDPTRRPRNPRAQLRPPQGGPSTRQNPNDPSRLQVQHSPGGPWADVGEVSALLFGTAMSTGPTTDVPEVFPDVHNHRPDEPCPDGSVFCEAIRTGTTPDASLDDVRAALEHGSPRTTDPATPYPYLVGGEVVDVRSYTPPVDPAADPAADQP